MTEEEKELILGYLDDRLSASQFDSLQTLLRENKDARSFLLDLGTIDTKLDDFSLSVDEEDKASRLISFSWREYAWSATACLLILFLCSSGYFLFSEPKIATIQSCEDAAWESDLPTTPGSELIPGTLKLRTGLASIELRSGVSFVLEGPAEVELISVMKTRLVAGMVMVEVPEQAIGFVLETPDGYAIDYGTSFAVVVDPKKNVSSFEVIDGEIGVHHPESGSEVRLVDNQTISIEKGIVSPMKEGEGEKKIPASAEIKRVFAGRNSTSIIRNDQRDLYLSSDVLLVKSTDILPSFDRRALLEFDISEVDLTQYKKIRLSLNLVPANGLRSHLPEENIFAIYGIKQPWGEGLLWAEAPQIEQAEKLGTFSIPRSKQFGNYGIENDALKKFVQSGHGKLLIVRETFETRPSGMIHAFANHNHPYYAPPVLEFY
ncbi:FecR family protein [Opitutales bacterium]|nr:FecR family protein [Opitutales bacterium]